MEVIAHRKTRVDSLEVSPNRLIRSDSIPRLLKRLDTERLVRINSARQSPEIVSTKEYQSLFKGYYRLRRGARFCNPFFQLLRHHLEQKTKPTIKAVLLDMYDKTQERHLSFASKLISTVDDSEPIYDRNVATLLHIPHGALPVEGWVDEAERRMDMLKRRLNAIISSSDWAPHEAAFNKAFPQAIQFSPLRKADLLIWASYEKPAVRLMK